MLYGLKLILKFCSSNVNFGCVGCVATLRGTVLASLKQQILGLVGRVGHVDTSFPPHGSNNFGSCWSCCHFFFCYLVYTVLALLKQQILGHVGRVGQVGHTSFGSNLKNKKTDAYFAIRERANKMSAYCLYCTVTTFAVPYQVLFVLVLYYLYFV